LTWIKGAIVLLSVLPTPIPTRAPVPQPAQIILIRHAEQPTDPRDPHLSQAGVQRAERLVSFITTDPAMTRLGLPVAVFATRTTKHSNGQRTQETVAPLARALKLPVQTPFLSKDYAALAHLILADPAYAGKTVLICWNHEEIPQLAAALGVTPEPPEWKDSTFDRVYVISYHNGKAALAASRYDGR
jgi:phosphohistidine phosphatase SixA